jgi:hypothetical protein
MVLLSMTPVVAEVVQYYLENVGDEADQDPSLHSPSEGNPISHGQLIDICTYLKRVKSQPRGHKDGRPLPTSLDELLKGCSIYPSPKAEASTKVLAK